MISGYLDQGRPTLFGVLVVPRLGISLGIRFLVDTGSDSTIVQVKDATDFGLVHDRDFADGPFPSISLGGSVLEYREPCELVLRHDDFVLNRLVLMVSFAQPSDVNVGLPSLLGRDVIGSYRLTFEQRAGVVTLE